MFIPNMLLKRLYTYSSLENTAEGISFSIKNRLSDAQLTALKSLKINGVDVPLSAISIDLGDGTIIPAKLVSAATPINFPLRQSLSVQATIQALPTGKHSIEIGFEAIPFGNLKFSVEDSIAAETKSDRVRIPRDNNDDYSESAIAQRQQFLSQYTQTNPKHITQYSFDAHTLKGNCEHFVGVAQVPIGIAGPLRINGENAQGDYLIPLATTEGTLVASYNRGIKVLNLCGGAKCTVSRDVMQRAPVFIFDDARGAREFAQWINKVHSVDGVEVFNPVYYKIKEEAETTSSVAKLIFIESYLSNKFTYLRFNFETGDAAGQNMVGRATFAACSWILDNYKNEEYPIRNFFLESNFATDKKASQVNIMRTRGKRVTAEAILKREVLLENMRVSPENLFFHAGIANVGSIMSGANNNGLHSANAIAAMFIATGQDVANVAESSAGIIYTELVSRPEDDQKDLYISITIPSLIVATHGGGTNLATQAECLNMLGCIGKGKVNHLAEIIAGVVLAGEISLASAISSNDWVSSHEQYGRNR